MFIDYLRLYNDEYEVRKIKFHQGINLIVDKTKENLFGTDTGNNVGKTTIIKLVDVCFGADPKVVYTDNKGNVNPIVKDFLVNNKIVLELCLVDNFEHPKEKVIIRRNFLRHSLREINGKCFENETEYEVFLKNKLYHLSQDKPSIRQLVSTCIRYKDEYLASALYNMSSYTSDLEYETLYLYMLGLNDYYGTEKQALNAKLTQETSFKKKLEVEGTKNSYKSKLNIIIDDISELSKQKDALKVDGSYEEKSSQLLKIKEEIGYYSSKINLLSIKKKMAEESIEKIQSERFDTDMEELKLLYAEMTKMNVQVSHTFDEMIVFHNSMVENKSAFLKNVLPKILDQININQLSLEKCIVAAKNLDDQLSNSISFAQYEEIIGKLNEKYRQKGELEHIISQIEESEETINTISTQIDELNSDLFTEQFDAKLQKTIDNLNIHYAKISKLLYGEQYAVKFEKRIHKKTKKPYYKFSTFNMNFSTGKIQGEILSYDLAYIKFASENNIPHFDFIMNDKKELMDNNQIVKLLDYSKYNNCQIVFSMLRDKLPQQLNDKKYIVVELSQDEKLFKIE